MTDDGGRSRTTGKIEAAFIVLTREEYNALVDALERAERMHRELSEIALDLRMQRMRLMQKPRR